MSSTMTTQMCVQKLAKMYGLNEEEAMRKLAKEPTKKEIAAQGIAERKAEREAKKAKKAAKPKRADTGYILYCKSIRPEISEGLSAKEIISKGAEMWRNLDQKKRDEWATKAKGLITPETSDSEEEVKPKKAKRSATGYQLYAASIRAELVAEMDDPAPKLVMKAQGARWQALDQEERDEWKAKAA